jgi:hypothetical protein
MVKWWVWLILAAVVEMFWPKMKSRGQTRPRQLATPSSYPEPTQGSPGAENAHRDVAQVGGRPFGPRALSVVPRAGADEYPGMGQHLPRCGAL